MRYRQSAPDAIERGFQRLHAVRAVHGPYVLIFCSAGGGNRTHTPLAGPRILSPVRLPVPPPRLVVHGLEPSDSTGTDRSPRLERPVKALSHRAIARFARELRMEDAVVEACRKNLLVWELYLNGIAAAGDRLDGKIV